MKKLLAILLCLAVMCSLSVTAMAADAKSDVTQFVWDEVKSDVDEIDKDGAFHQIGSYVIWLPSFYEEQELSAERLEQGYVANILAFDQSSAVMAFTDINEEKADLETLAKAYTGAGLDASVVEVNGLPAMLYIDESSDTCNLLFLEGEEKENEMVFSFYPYSDEDFQILVSLLLRTIQPGVVWDHMKEYADRVDKNGVLAQIGDYDYAIWVPSVLENTDLTEEEIADGYVAYLMPSDESAGVSFYTWENTDKDTIKSLQDYYLSEGYEDTEVSLINGIQAVTYTDEEYDSLYVVFLLSEDEVMSISFWPASDEGFEEIAMLMASSIQKMEK